MGEWTETELGKIPAEWSCVSIEVAVNQGTLEKPIDGNHGSIHPKGSDFVKSGIPFVMASDIHNGRIDLRHCKFITKEQANCLQKGFSVAGDVLLTHKASLGRTAIVPEIETAFIMLTPQVTYYRVKDPKSINNKYLKYYFDSPNFQDVLVNHGDAGSTRAYVGITAQRALPLCLPDISEQEAMAEVLSSLDNKIDLLHQQSQTLEALAETLFRHTFIDNAQDDWKKKSLLDLIDLIGGGTPKTSVTEYWLMGDIPWLSGGDIASSHKSILTKSEKSITQKGLENSSAKLLPRLSTVISARGTVGKYALLSRPMAYSQSNYGVFPKVEDCFFFTYLLINHAVAELQSAAYGSVFDTITTTTFQNVSIKVPEDEQIKKFDEEVSVYFEKKLNCVEQIQVLENLRDTLLPKLMSGEVRVQYDEAA